MATKPLPHPGQKKKNFVQYKPWHNSSMYTSNKKKKPNPAQVKTIGGFPMKWFGK